MNIHFHHFLVIYFLFGLCSRTNIRTVRSYLFIYSPSMLPSNCLSVQHTSLKSVHFTAPSYRLTASPLLRFILVYTPYFVINARTHIVSAPTPSMCLRTSCIPCCCPLLLVSPSSGTIFAQALYTTDTCEIYLTLAGCEITSTRGLQSRTNTRIHVDTNVGGQSST
jgi:hypothetical protein